MPAPARPPGIGALEAVPGDPLIFNNEVGTAGSSGYRMAETVKTIAMSSCLAGGNMPTYGATATNRELRLEAGDDGDTLTITIAASGGDRIADGEWLTIDLTAMDGNRRRATNTISVRTNRPPTENDTKRSGCHKDRNVAG